MLDLGTIVAKVAEVTGAELHASNYSGYLSKKLTLTSSLSLKREGNSYHIEVTNPKGEMLLFPVVTSSKYEAAPEEDSAEKRRYFLRADVTLQRANLKALLQRAIAGHTDNYKLPKTFYETELQRVEAGDNSAMPTFTHCTFQLRGTDQRQLEIGTAADGHDFITLRRCLLPGDYLVFLQRGAATFDVFGLAAESVAGTSWSGWQAGDPQKLFVEAGQLVASSTPGASLVSGAGNELGPATEQKIAEVVSACERYGSRSIIALAGVPGTGKSHIASIAAARLAGDPANIREIQFHASFTYEEFIEGMRIGAGGSVEIKDGIFLELNERALRNPKKRYVLLVEELTRANLAAVLGELLTYVEHREREFTTLYARKQVRVAPNLIFLATYNPLDRSAIDMDAALLRRLRIVAFPPSREQLGEMLHQDGVRREVIERLDALFRACEAHKDYETWMPFGHGIFSGVRDDNPDLYELWQERLRYLLYRPGMTEHRFAATIRENYPWTAPGFSVPSAPPATPSVPHEETSTVPPTDAVPQPSTGSAATAEPPSGSTDVPSGAT